MVARKKWRMGAGLSTSLVLLLVALVPADATVHAQSEQPNPSAGWRLPFIRVGHTAIYDKWNNRIVVFGGWNGQQFFNDVWALDLTPGAMAWTKLNPDGPWPGARGQHTAIFDEVTRRMIIYGGHGLHYNFDDVWALDLATPGAERWTQLQPSGPAIGGRRYHTAIWDALNGRMIVFGGNRGGALLNDVWALDLTPGAEAWSQLAVTGSVPAARMQHSAVYDLDNHLMVVFGGVAADGLRNDTWALNLDTLHWTHMTPQGTPPPARRGHTAVMNTAQQNMLVFGGLGSGGFRNDLWKLDLFPGAVQWVHLNPNGGPPGTRAWHAAAYRQSPASMFIFGGRGMGSLSDEAQWGLNVGGMTWLRLTPSLPGGWGGGLGLEKVESDGIPEVTLEIEDAAPGTMAHLLLSSEVWFVVKLKTSSAAEANDVDVTLDVVASKFDVTQVGVRHKDADEVVGWTTPVSLPGGQYRLDNVDLTKGSGEDKYQNQVVFKAIPKAETSGTSITAIAQGPAWTAALESSATARIHRDPPAWIVTNRTGLFDTYDDSQVSDLLDEIFEVAADRSAVVFYLDRFVPDLMNWNNSAVDYTSETTANQVAHQVAEWLATRIVSWNPYPNFAHPTYLVIVGDDNIVPFYRKQEYVAAGIMGDQSEDDDPNCWGDDGVCDQVVSHNFFLTDNPYGDQEYGTGYADWESGGMEAAVGRIVGATAADMQRFLENATLGPNPNVQRAILASDGVDWWLSGEDNDAHNVLKFDLGYTLNEALIDSDANKGEIKSEMQKGFSVMGAAHHGETYVWQVPACDTFPICFLVSDEIPDYGPGGQIPANRPFFYFDACRVGMSYTDGWNWGEPGVYDDSMVYALVHEGASGIIASAGKAYASFTNNAATAAEVLANNFWVESRVAPERSDPLGWSLMRAKNKHPVGDNITQKKTVQTFTYFGLPWMRLPGHGSGHTAQTKVPSISWSLPTRRPATGPEAMDATYMITTVVDASVYAISTTVEGFDLIDVQGLGQRIQDRQVVLPESALEVILPLSATVTSLVFTPTQSVALPGLDIPTFLNGVSIPGGPTGGYTNTVDGVYPVTASFESRVLDTYQLVRVHVVPVTYDATNDQATLYRSVDVALEYDTPETIALTYFEPDQLQYLPGETISVTAHLLNAGDLAETVTATLVLQDAQGRIVGFKGSGPLDIPAGGSRELKLDWAGPLDGDHYLARMLIWQAGQVVAGAGTIALVTEGEVSAVSVPELLMAGEEGTFAVTFHNLASSATAVLGSLAVYDQDGVLAAFLPAETVAVAGGASATLSFLWTPERSGHYTASFMISAGGQEYGPLSKTFDVRHRTYLPVVLRAYP